LKLKIKAEETPKIVDPNARKIIFSHNRAMGDAIMFTAGIRDFCLLFPDIRVNVKSNQGFLWENNPFLDRTLKEGDPGVEFYKVGYPAIGSCNNTNVHFTQMFLLDMIAITDLHNKLPLPLGEFCAAFANGAVGDKNLGNPDKNPEAREPFIALNNKYREFCKRFARQRGDIYMTDEEKKYNLIKEAYGIEKYWVIAPGGKRDCTAKVWDWRKFQGVIDHFEGLIKFVVIGKSDLLVEKLRNVIDLVDKFNKKPRDLIPLVYHADGCVSGPSMLVHMAAAMPPRYRKERKPCVSIFGGREPIGWSWYTNHQILHSNGVYTCCDNGGCWKARTYPLPKDPKHNKSLCITPIESNGRTVQACMEGIRTSDVIRAIEKYYEGDIYSYEKRGESVSNPISIGLPTIVSPVSSSSVKEINLVGNLNSKGGGEQSLLKIAEVLQDANWKVNLHPWGSVHSSYNDSKVKIQPHSFENGMAENMKPGLPLLFYANDCTGKFAEYGESVVNNSSNVIIGINYVNRPLPMCHWLSKSGKLRAVIFQNTEKMNEWTRDEVGFNGLKKIVLFGAIELDKFLEICTKNRKKDENLVVLRHSVGDYRKFVTKESQNRGEKIHIWQKHFDKELDTKFYTRLLKKFKNIQFEFMEGHKELINHFKSENRMIFHEWNAMPVNKFLERGHVYLYRTSNLWRDNYPRVVAEALAAGLPVITEPRDGTFDRVRHGDTGFHCVHYNEFQTAIEALIRKEKLRQEMGRNAKDWARMNLDPRRWVDIIEGIL